MPTLCNIKWFWPRIYVQATRQRSNKQAYRYACLNRSGSEYIYIYTLQGLWNFRLRTLSVWIKKWIFLLRVQLGSLIVYTRKFSLFQFLSIKDNAKLKIKFVFFWKQRGKFNLYWLLWGRVFWPIWLFFNSNRHARTYLQWLWN